MKPFRSRKYLDAGKGKKCTICRASVATDPAHIRLKTFCGTSQKPHDFMILDACRTCHDLYGDMNNPADAELVLAALCRTLERRFHDGVLEVK